MAKVEVIIEGWKPDQPLELIQGEQRVVRLRALASDNTEITAGITSKLTATKGGIVKLDPVVGGYTLEALGVKNQDSTTVKVEVNGQDRSEAVFTVKVTEAIAAVEVEGGNALSLAEGDTFLLKFNVKGHQSESLNAANALAFETPIVSAALRPLVRLNRDPATGGYNITALPLPTAASVPGTLTFTAKRGLNNQSVPALIVNVTIREKFGYITFEPPPRGFLLPGGSFTTLAIVRGKDGSPKGNYGVEFKLADESHRKWIALAPEGNKVNIYWSDPSPTDLATLPDGTRESRPTQVIVRAIARSAIPGEQITGEIFVRMGEVSKFAPLKVKLNLMDAVTAADLYGKVLSDEYYVLTVRLFNNLRDDTTKEVTGDSILAYSSSMEVAVGIEKKFDGEIGSVFPNVIGKGAARDLARKRRDAAIALANRQADIEITAANEAQANLEAAIRNERTARKEAADAREEALELREKLSLYAREAQRLRRIANTTFREPDRRLADKAADEAEERYDVAAANAREVTYHANVQIRRAQDAAEETNRVRASILRASANRVTVSQNVMGNSDPDTAVDDGKWRPVNPSDFNRISEPKLPDEVPLPLLPEVPDPLDNTVMQGDLSALGNAEQTPIEENQTEEEEEDPPCRGTITYRPFTFEMMVNTVDRRDGRSLRSRVFTLLEAVGTGTSFVTSIAVPGRGSDLPLGLEKYRNLLIPGIDKLYPNFKEQQRQNIVSQAMKEIEEIPFGSDITRVIFIPRKTIRGLIRGHEARISEVCPFYFKIQVAIINKRSTIQQGTATQ